MISEKESFKKLIWILSGLIILGIGYTLYQIYLKPSAIQYIESDVTQDSQNQLGKGATQSQTAKSIIIVHLSGGVKHPGVYELTSPIRVLDAIKAAGGALPSANLDKINLAKKVKDGEKINVPIVTTPKPTTSKKATPASKTTQTADKITTKPAFPIDLNTATLEDLITVPGIGSKRAQEIIDYRTQHGGFNSVNDLKNIRGIKGKRIQQLKEYLK